MPKKLCAIVENPLNNPAKHGVK